MKSRRLFSRLLLLWILVMQDGQEERDRINDLPDDIRVHILSFLPTKTTATTSILSSKLNLIEFVICHNSVDGYRAVVERYLNVEVRGLDRNGQPVKVVASGWQARILQHECDHLEGTLYVDKMQKRTFRTVENLDLPLATGCPKIGPR